MHFTKIVATIGPATDTPEKLKRLIKLGMNVARLNFSHGSHETHGATIKRLKALQDVGENIAILLDTKGPQVRTGDVHEPIRIRRGQSVVFTSNVKKPSASTVIEVSYDDFPKDARGAKKILIDNGVMEFSITGVKGDSVHARALDSGSIGSRRHVNLPGADISLPSFTKKDWQDIDFGIRAKVDFFAPSFVRSGDDIDELREHLARRKCTAHIIAKIETPRAVDNIEDIVRAADGIMVARGDLGSEVPFELVPGIQDDIVAVCRAHGKPVIVATHMLESMIENPMPTRAEVTDIAHAAATMADGVMLSGETTAGKHPFKAIDAMRRVVTRTEQRPRAALLAGRSDTTMKDARTEQARAAVVLAEKMKARAIMVVTRHGHTARAVSRFRPHQPILAYTESETVCRQLLLPWGVMPFITDLKARDPEATVESAVRIAQKNRHIRPGDTIVIVSDVLASPRSGATASGHVMSIQIRTVR